MIGHYIPLIAVVVVLFLSVVIRAASSSSVATFGRPAEVADDASDDEPDAP